MTNTPTVPSEIFYRTRPRKPRAFQAGDEWAFLLRGVERGKTLDREEHMFYTPTEERAWW
ncbi:MAG: hypothetical protein NVS2B12_20270 [Ktedonobacteraceae bacterium]